MYYKTETGSLYEVDIPNCLIRRIAGTSQPTDRVGEDGIWKKFIGLSWSGSRLVIAWRFNKETNILETTVTSPVIEELYERTVAEDQESPILYE